jgi:hypothetical protein
MAFILIIGLSMFDLYLLFSEFVNIISKHRINKYSINTYILLPFYKIYKRLNL